jgi:Lrp/AsnC family transcriptional regulator for asnA, asnC and gidA
MSKIDELDIKIIKELQKDARQSYREIAEKLKVAEGTVYNRVGKLKDSGIIRGFIADVDYGKIGYELVALIGVIVEGGKLPQIEKRLSEEPNVTAVYDVTGEYDAIVVAKFKDREGLNGLVKRVLAMEYVKRTYTMVVLNVVKETHKIEL